MSVAIPGNAFFAARDDPSSVPFSNTSDETLRSGVCLKKPASFEARFLVIKERLNSFSESGIDPSGLGDSARFSDATVPRETGRCCHGESGRLCRGNAGSVKSDPSGSSLDNPLLPVNLSNASLTASSRLRSGVLESRLRNWLKSMLSNARLLLASPVFIGERDLARSTLLSATKPKAGAPGINEYVSS